MYYQSERIKHQKIFNEENIFSPPPSRARQWPLEVFKWGKKWKGEKRKWKRVISSCLNV